MAQFKPALIVVDFQEDFCPPNGSLAVPGGRAIAPLINTLLALPFALKVATRDWHPASHISFATNHPGAEPFTSSVTITRSPSPNPNATSSTDTSSSNPNPNASSDTTSHSNTASSYTTTLWPPHCIAHTPGALLLPSLRSHLLTHTIDKGTRPDREMYSAFRDPFGESDSGLTALLKDNGITDVVVVGLAFDYCVKATAEHAREDGLGVWVVGEATRAVFPERWEEVVTGLEGKGVRVVGMEEVLTRMEALGA